MIMTQRAIPGVMLAAALLLGPVCTAAGAGVERPGFAQADLLIERAIEESQLPGAVLLVGRENQVLYRKAYGFRSVRPERVPMTVDTTFDLASLSKPVGCA